MSMETGMDNIKVGDWVSGVTVMDEKFIGFVDEADQPGIYRIVVTQSDRERIVGKRVGARASKVRKLDESSTAGSSDETDVLIELALMTWDESWFRELMELKRRLPEEKLEESKAKLPVNRIQLN
ncbi:hypothetical protein M3223_20325 [Paenibacillus pasadenensis]|uniref:hypothetical protein n=1 Tax=Paenibacillus pasadenensis TaxID=217090 RepID=UPI00203BB4E0|nr:hypothetical protein [Paenibacillus pasadenensis]MCM3749703.1 hypothetical protein [Paenibacillus pasadenensis]